jgi:hypothetical protein
VIRLAWFSIDSSSESFVALVLAERALCDQASVQASSNARRGPRGWSFSGSP